MDYWDHHLLSSKAHQSDITNDLVLKADIADFNALTTNVHTQLQGKVDNSDFADYYTKTQVDNNAITRSVPTPMLIVKMLSMLLPLMINQIIIK